jgi:hypothetical protein
VGVKLVVRVRDVVGVIEDVGLGGKYTYARGSPKRPRINASPARRIANNKVLTPLYTCCFRKR